MPVNVKEVKRRLSFLLKDENLVTDYIRQFGPIINIKNINQIKSANNEDLEDETGSEGEDPIFEINLTCPICNHENITGYELKAKSQQIIENKLFQNQYIGAMGHKTLDYDKISVTVCSRCLFASPDKKDFIGINKVTKNKNSSQILPNVILTLQEKIGERKALLQNISNIEDYFKRPRKFDATLLSYKLAAMRAKVEVYHELPNSLFKLGSYYLKIAKFNLSKNKDDEPPLREALEYFEECFKTSNVSTETIEYKVLYLLVALFIRLGEFKKAHPYIGVFEKIRTDLKIKAKTDASVNLSIIDKWVVKIKNLWEDREEKDLFK